MSAVVAPGDGAAVTVSLERSSVYGMPMTLKTVTKRGGPVQLAPQNGRWGSRFDDSLEHESYFYLR